MLQASGLPEPTRNVPRDGGRGRQRLPDTQTCTELDKLELPGYQQDYRSLTGFTANTNMHESKQRAAKFQIIEKLAHEAAPQSLVDACVKHSTPRSNKKLSETTTIQEK